MFDRQPSWDPRLDPVVRQEASRLRKRLARYYETSGADAKIRIELPVGAYVPVFHQTIEEVPIVVAEPALPRKTRLWVYTTAGVLCVAIVLIGLVSWRAVVLPNSPTSLAVLPFVNLTSDPANQYFADGLTDEVTDSLSRLNSLRVIARSSAFQFKGKNTDIREVGRILNVANVLEGSIEHSGNRIRIVAHLERVSDGFHLWSNTFERNTADLFAVESELASNIAESLKSRTGPAVAKHVPNAAAHDLVMKGRYEMQQLTTASLNQAESDFQRAIALDPQYAEAYYGLGVARTNQGYARGSIYQTLEERDSAQRFLREALRLDPGLMAAHATLAIFIMQYDRDWRLAERELLLATSGPSSAAAETHYSSYLVFQGRFSEAERHIARALELDPSSASTRMSVAQMDYLEGHFAQSLEIAQSVANQHPKMLAPQQFIGGNLVAEGHFEQALAIFRPLEKTFPPIQVYEAMALGRAGRREEAIRLLRPFEEKYPEPGVPMQWFALAYAAMGDGANTLKWLERSADRHEYQVLNSAVNPAFAFTRNTADFRALLRRLGLDSVRIH